MRKRIRQYALISCCSIAMVASLVGCGNKKESSDDTIVEVTEESVADDIIEEDDNDNTSEVTEDTEETTTEFVDTAEEDAIKAFEKLKKEVAKQKTPAKTNAATKPANNASKPASNTNKPTDNTSKPAGDTTKPADNTVVESEDDVDTSLNVTQYAGYDLMWHDEFSGSTLNRNDWNVELHEPGWVNAELQKYVDSADNIYLKDGKLIIKPIKTGDGKDATYTSGRINTQGKHDYTYGRFECRAKVPEGKGYLPAFWMMPTDENVYGQWPKCGEIDIMEVHGSAVNTAYGTIHYGNPHGQSQGTKYDSKNYADNYHTYAVDWEPGKITWYIDGVKFHEETKWFSTVEGQGTVTYPAPFDQPFYVILNLAVGGSWVGYPDATTDFANQAFEVDYVRIYQKTDGYDDSNVEAPVDDDVYREADATGNYIINGDFSTADDLSGSGAWEFLTAADGVAKAAIENGQVRFQTTNAGTEDYSVQLVQAGVPLVQGTKYRLTFDAYAASARTMIVDISGPRMNYQRYMPDTKVNLGTTKQTYTYEFDMNATSDALSRLEYNLGKTSPISDVYIDNVRLEKIGTFEVDKSKKVLTDGNYIYNGKFQEGSKYLGYWEIEKSGSATVDYKVSALADNRRFTATTTNCGSAADVKLVQKDLPLNKNMTYSFSFDAELVSGSNNVVKAYINGQEYSFTLANGNKHYSCNVEIGDTVVSNTFKLDLGVNGTVKLDNIMLCEDALLMNGNFNSGLAGFDPYCDGSASATWTVDSLSEDNAFDITINDTGDKDWKIQLKQNNVTLEKGEWYKLSFRAKSNLNRNIMYAIQRDGSTHKTAKGEEDWMPYTPQVAGSHIVAVTGEYQTYECEFQMTEETDTAAIFTISMGAVGGKQITTQHRICIDDIKLEKIEAKAPEFPEVEYDTNMLVDTSFAEIGVKWNETIAGGAAAVRSVADNAVTYAITNVGSADWNIQLKQGGLPIKNGEKYLISFKIKSTSLRTVKCALMSDDSRNYDWYGGKDIALLANKEQTVVIPVTMSKESDANAFLNFSLGKIADVATPVGTVTISDVSIMRVHEFPVITPEQPEPEVDPYDGPVENNMLEGFADNVGWGEGIKWNPIAGDEGKRATVEVLSDSKLNVKVTDEGTNEYDVQLKYGGLTFTGGNKYKVTMYITSDVDRKVKAGSQIDASPWTGLGGGQTTSLTAGERTKISFDIDMTGKSTTNSACLYLSMGEFGDERDLSTITIENVSLVLIDGEEPINTPSGDSSNILGAITSSNVGWGTGKIWNPITGGDDNTAAATYEVIDNKGIKFTITNLGSLEHHIQLMRSGLSLEKGKKYKVKMSVTSSVDRDVKAGAQLNASPYTWYGGGAVTNLSAGVKKDIEFEINMTGDTTSNACVYLSMGNFGDASNLGTVTIENVSLVEVPTTPDIQGATPDMVGATPDEASVEVSDEASAEDAVVEETVADDDTDATEVVAEKAEDTSDDTESDDTPSNDDKNLPKEEDIAPVETINSEDIIPEV